jgi:hypothetical protein
MGKIKVRNSNTNVTVYLLVLFYEIIKSMARKKMSMDNTKREGFQCKHDHDFSTP